MAGEAVRPMLACRAHPLPGVSIMNRIGMLVGLALASSLAAACAVEASAPGVDTENPVVEIAHKKACGPAALRHCSTACEGAYGLFCFFGTVCDPVNHRCDKAAASPIDPPIEDVGRIDAADLVDTVDKAEPESR